MKSLLKDCVDYPVYIENDANACCWGELVFNKDEDLSNFIFLVAEFYNDQAGIGMGFVFNNKIHYGRNFTAGEFKSIKAHSTTKDSQVSIDPTDTDFSSFASELTEHIAFLVNTLNLDHIFIGGDLEHHKTIISPLLERSIRNNILDDKDNLCNLHYSSIGKYAAAFGAAGMMMNKLFNNKDYIQNL